MAIKESIPNSKENYLFYIYIIFLFLAVLGLRHCTGFSVLAASGGCSQVAAGGLLIAVASRCRHGL